MAGHSKWANIKRRKDAVDAKRGKIFTRLAREVTIAARAGGGSLESNAALRLAVDRAKKQNMPKDNIERAIKKGTGELAGGNIDEIMYEAYAPHGIPLLIRCLTDNRNRTLAELRRIFNKHGGNLAEPGAVSWMFDTKGYITVERTNQDPDEFFMIAVDAGAEDVEVGDDLFEVYTEAGDLHTVNTTLAENEIDVSESVLSQIPKNEIELASKETQKVLGVIERLEELDDVDQVYSGLALSDAVLAELEPA